MSSAGCRKLITRVGGRRAVTPLVIVFVTIGGTDILFALEPSSAPPSEAASGNTALS